MKILPLKNDDFCDRNTAGKDYGCGAMEAIYFGDSNWVAHSPWTAPGGSELQHKCQVFLKFYTENGEMVVNCP